MEMFERLAVFSGGFADRRDRHRSSIGIAIYAKWVSRHEARDV